MWGIMIPSFPSVTSAGPHPPPQATYFSVDGICASSTTALVGFLPFNAGIYLGNSGTEDIWFFPKKRGLKQRHSKPLRGKPEEITLRENWWFFWWTFKKPLRLHSFVFLESNLSLTRGGHGTNLLVAWISFHWASPSERWLDVLLRHFSSPGKFG